MTLFSIRLQFLKGMERTKNSKIKYYGLFCLLVIKMLCFVFWKEMKKQ